MPHLILENPDGTRRMIPLIKRLTAVGSAPENDVVLPLPGVAKTALHLEMEGNALRLAGHRGADYALNGKRRGEGRLAQGDLIALGGAILHVELRSAPSETPLPRDPAPDPASTALRTLVRFAERMMSATDIQALLDEMMDAAISLTHADKGFLILMEGDRFEVKVARNVPLAGGSAGSLSESAISGLSDSIIAKVVQGRTPLIVHDALHDTEFGQSESVVNLKLSSVMCAPLMEKGNLFGLLYVGNDRMAHRFEAKSLDLLTLFAAQASLMVRNAILVNELRIESADLRLRLEESQYGELVGACAGMREVFRRIDKLATTDISVLITGETGTGKELLAREIHRRSARSQGPFVTINCGAIPENLLESELFGHVRGAFTGAVTTRIGRFQAANGGTLFLDEVGDMPLPLQVKMLRSLQERTVVKVGDTRPETVDIRVVAATHRTLEDEVKEGRFREDLYYRLNVVQLLVPPLRERGDDVQVLARYLLRRFSREIGGPARGFAKSALDAMRRYSWPGNVRELENRIKKALVLSDKALMTSEDLGLPADAMEPIASLAEAKGEFQRRYINQILERNGGNRTKTAKDLDVDARTIFRHLERLEAERMGKTLPGTEADRELDD